MQESNISKTPDIDHLASNGIRVIRVYTNNYVSSTSPASHRNERVAGYFKQNFGKKGRESIGSIRLDFLPNITPTVRSLQRSNKISIAGQSYGVLLRIKASVV